MITSEHIIRSENSSTQHRFAKSIVTRNGTRYVTACGVSMFKPVIVNSPHVNFACPKCAAKAAALDSIKRSI